MNLDRDFFQNNYANLFSKYTYKITDKYNAEGSCFPRPGTVPISPATATAGGNPAAPALTDLEIKKKAYQRLLKLLISFCTATIIYYICKIFDPFKNLQDNAEVQTNGMFAYIKKRY